MPTSIAWGCASGGLGTRRASAGRRRGSLRWKAHILPLLFTVDLCEWIRSGDRGAHGREEVVGADPRGEAGLGEDLALPSFQAGEAERDAALLEFFVQLSQRVDRRGVEERPGLGIEHQPPDVLGRVGEREHALAEVFGVDEEGGASKR